MGDAKFESYLVKTGTAIANHCRTGTEREGLKTLYHADCVSVEPLDGPKSRETKGRDAINGKHEWWESAFEEHKVTTKGPFFHAPNRFSLIFDMDVTERESGQRMQMSEVALYTVDTDGKVIREEFFYAPMDA